MKLLTQSKDEPNCLVYAAAMVLDTYPEYIFSKIGHRGQANIWPQVPYPHNLAGVHIQEIQDVALNVGYCFYPIEYYPESRYSIKAMPHYPYTYDQIEERFFKAIKNRKGIIVSDTHAVAWDGNKVFDPNGLIYGIKTFQERHYFREAWLLGKIT